MITNFEMVIFEIALKSTFWFFSRLDRKQILNGTKTWLKLYRGNSAKKKINLFCNFCTRFVNNLQATENILQKDKAVSIVNNIEFK